MENFNWQKYLQKYPDLQLAGINNKNQAWRHWINFGKKEGRIYYSLDNSDNNIINYDLSTLNIATVVCNFMNYDIDFEKYNYFINNFDFFYITNVNMDTNNTKINVIVNNITFKNEYIAEQYYKSNLLKLDFLQKYNHIIFLIPCFDNLENIDFYIKKYINNNNNFLLFKHFIENIKDFIYYSKYEYFSYEILKNQIKKYFNKKITFFNTNFFIVKNNDINNNILNSCFNEISKEIIPYDVIFSDLINNFLNNCEIFNIKINEQPKYIYKNINNYINFIDHIVWINLDRCTQRKKNMEKLFTNLLIPNTRITAIDGQTYNFSKNIFNLNIKRKFSNSEKACTLSHLKAINYLKDIVGEYFMICEDDITFENVYILDNNLKEIIKNAPDFDVLMLSKTYYNNLKELYTKWVSNISSTGCYIITKTAILKICSLIIYNDKDDTFTFNNVKIPFEVADLYIYMLLNTYVYKYNFISSLDEDSTIHSNHIEHHKRSSNFQKSLIINDIFA